MKFNKLIKVLPMLFMGLIIFSSCEEEQVPVQQEEMESIVSIAQRNADLSTLVQVLSEFPDLTGALSSETGTFTVFAPTNQAFSDLLEVIGQSSVYDVPEEVMRGVLEYHVLSSKVMSGDLSDGLSASTLNGENITVGMNGGAYTISGAGILTADVMASNGTVHIIDHVLVPSSIGKYVNTILEPAIFNKSFSVLVQAVKSADPSVMELLMSSGPGGNGMTLFAPSDEAFANSGISSLPDQSTLNNILAYHLLDGMVMAADLPLTSPAAPYKIEGIGGNLYLSNQGNGVYLNGVVNVVVTDINPGGAGGESNGVVHVIDKVLLPASRDIVGIAIDAGFNELAAALTRAELVGALQGEGPFTAFAPTDQAFYDLYAALGVSSVDEIPLETLKEVLLYHVIPAKVFSTDLSDGINAETLSSGSEFTINITDGTVTLTDNQSATPATVTQTDIFGTNGVIHIIDKVILP